MCVSVSVCLSVCLSVSLSHSLSLSLALSLSAYVPQRYVWPRELTGSCLDVPVREHQPAQSAADHCPAVWLCTEHTSLHYRQKGWNFTRVEQHHSHSGISQSDSVEHYSQTVEHRSNKVEHHLFKQ